MRFRGFLLTWLTNFFAEILRPDLHLRQQLFAEFLALNIPASLKARTYLAPLRYAAAIPCAVGTPCGQPILRRVLNRLLLGKGAGRGVAPRPARASARDYGLGCQRANRRVTTP